MSNTRSTAIAYRTLATTAWASWLTMNRMRESSSLEESQTRLERGLKILDRCLATRPSSWHLTAVAKANHSSKRTASIAELGKQRQFNPWNRTCNENWKHEKTKRFIHYKWNTFLKMLEIYRASFAQIFVFNSLCVQPPCLKRHFTQKRDSYIWLEH